MSEDGVNAALFSAVVENPHSFVVPSRSLEEKCRELLDQFYQEQTARLSGRCGPNKLQNNQGTDIELVWSQLKARSDEILPRLRVWRQRCEAALDIQPTDIKKEHQPPPVHPPQPVSRTPAEDEASNSSDASSQEGSGTSVSEEDVEQDPELPETVEDELDDGFFRQDDLEAFVEDAEELHRQGKLFDDEEDEESSEEGLGSQDSDPEIDDDGSYSDSDQSKENLRYHEFFRSAGGEKPRSLRLRTTSTKKRIEDEEIEKETPLQQQWARSRVHIEKLENANVGDKAWHLKGEVKGADRPQNSLLEAVLDHDVTTRPAPVITEETTADIESIIRQRILDETFDDVERKVAPDDLASEGKKKQKEEVAQEKSKLGLGDLYEKEYADQLSKTKQDASEETENETPLQKEVNYLYQQLSERLDMLSNLHFSARPKAFTKEMEARPNLPAVMAEEAIPGAVSDADLLAPSEVYAGAKKPVAEKELSKEERKQRRNKLKHEWRSEAKASKQKRKAAEQLDPDLKERNAKKRALEALKEQSTGAKVVFHKNAKHGEVRKPSKEFTDSAKFFRGLEESARKDIQKTKREGADEDGENKSRKSDGRSFKL